MATRIDRLAQPKPDLLRFPDRRSVYWLDKLPAKRSGTATNIELSPRWSQLTESKQTHSGFMQSRRSPKWHVSMAALTAYPSDRVRSLALPRLPAVGWQQDRPLLATLRAAVRAAEASPRVCQLAQPKRGSLLHRSDHPENGKRPTSSSSRIFLLAAAKTDHPLYLPDRPVTWPLSAATGEAVASERVQELAQPKPRCGLFEGYNPYAVSPAARAASASPRIQELSLPLPRKCRGK
ncbi:theg spermatid protein [Clupea harengus]|uniref:Theg spermatid protein n=1 Tax=Clupea harengus TaxID=7950 RepID=A0A6P8F4N0_CLUHA|nr:theg spermatid protein [Clupea harengus]XP_042559698.1 theg spermatid protein [Clupea harengus]